VALETQSAWASLAAEADLLRASDFELPSRERNPFIVQEFGGRMSEIGGRRPA
jgi:hypothetical protein